jgi:aldehyde:ferredoxin oxidoreductase
LNNGDFDTLGACSFAGFCYVATPDNVIRRLLQACYNWDDLPENVIQALGKATFKMEREFNHRAGFTAKDDRLPEWVTKEALHSDLGRATVKSGR